MPSRSTNSSIPPLFLCVCDRSGGGDDGGGSISCLRLCFDRELQRLALRLEGFRKAVRPDAMPEEVQRVGWGGAGCGQGLGLGLGLGQSTCG